MRAIALNSINGNGCALRLLLERIHAVLRFPARATSEVRLFRNRALAGIHPSPIGQREEPGHAVLLAIVGFVARLFGFGFSDCRLRSRLFARLAGCCRASRL